MNEPIKSNIKTTSSVIPLKRARSSDCDSTTNSQHKKLKFKKSKCLVNDQDFNLPKELKEKFTPLKCLLCEAIMNSTLQARMHYTGKVHEKKVNQYLQEWSKRTGNPIPKKEKQIEEVDQDYLTCTKCKLTFTSKLNAQQHYMGKNHLKRKVPIPKSTPNITDPSGRFNIGQEFKNKTNILNLKEEKDDPLSSLNCSICQIKCSSKDQMIAHLNGGKHKKKSARAEVLKDVIITDSQGSDSILECVTKKEKVDSTKKDFSIYRTPSGFYYCQICDVSLNSSIQFLQHNESKKHKSKQTLLKK